MPSSFCLPLHIAILRTGSSRWCRVGTNNAATLPMSAGDQPGNACRDKASGRAGMGDGRQPALFTSRPDDVHRDVYTLSHIHPHIHPHIHIHIHIHTFTYTYVRAYLFDTKVHTFHTFIQPYSQKRHTIQPLLQPESHTWTRLCTYNTMYHPPPYEPPPVDGNEWGTIDRSASLPHPPAHQAGIEFSYLWRHYSTVSMVKLVVGSNLAGMGWKTRM
jgi:hypothetical protein